LFLIFIATAHAMGEAGGGGGGQGGGGLSIIFPLLAIMVIFYFLLIRPQQKAEKKKKEMIASVKKGYRVITAGGIRGTVTKVYDKERVVLVNIAKGVDVEVALAKIEAAAPPGEELPAAGGDAKKAADDKIGKTTDKKGPRRPRK
jgi:preprotein translocase subunit YajC